MELEPAPFILHTTLMEQEFAADITNGTPTVTVAWSMDHANTHKD
jgi:hypothetical protein